MRKIICGIFLAIVSVAVLEVGCDPKATPASSVVPTINTSFGYSTFASGTNSGIRGVAIDALGNVYYCTVTNPGYVIKITPQGVPTTVVSGLYYPRSLAVEPNGGAIYVDSGPRPRRLLRVVNGVKTTLEATDRRIVGITFKNGTVYYTGRQTHNVYSISPSGTGRKIVTAGFNRPMGVGVDPAGNIFVADRSAGTVNKIANGVSSVFASGLSAPWGLAVDGHGNVFVSERGNGNFDMFTPAGVKTVLNTYSSPTGVAVDAQGNAYVGDSNNYAIYKVTIPNWP